ncbi:HPP family protein [Xinfangfangia sp. CPCC 101601]|uniref:HPP family protein n=1 Tax=Pseudogemmobacter lacusdianii TaxID=3069608 RepID=A0ABU0VXV6_9RHOB|nr:HPP family protein [Xinfangfangia sp. CPCC 101601]MDQ2066343.1 HPP family protein [Xinfangfangia sp. CPCC 101601]
MKTVLRALGPAMPRPATGDSARAALGAALILLITGLLLGHLPGAPAAGLIAPFGATAFLICVVPNSPLAQPWSVVIGSVVSAMAALAALWLLPASLPPLAIAGLAVALAILAMHASRSMHPPGGAVALVIVLSADPAAPPSLLYALSPVGDGAALLVLCGYLWHRLSGRTYPFRQPPVQSPNLTADPTADRRLGLRPEDLQTILTRLRLSPNLGPEDLGRALEVAEAEATARHLGGLTAADIMSRDVVALPPEATAHELAQAFRHHGFNTLPLRDAKGGFAGLIHDRDLIEADPDQPATALAQPAVTQPPEAQLAEILPLLLDTRQQSLPIVDQGQLVGIVTRSDLVALLAAKIRSQAPETA